MLFPSKFRYLEMIISLILLVNSYITLILLLALLANTGDCLKAT